MNVLVAYASRHGATREIGQRIAERLRAAGLEAEAQQVTAVRDIAAYQAYVIGSAVYLGHWQQEAAELVRHNHRLLRKRSTWLFSSGPLGVELGAGDGLDPRVAAEPSEIGQFRKAIRSRGDRVFFGALDSARLGLLTRAIRVLPSGRALLPAGDFRDWRDIDGWADAIARELMAPASVPSSRRRRRAAPVETKRVSSLERGPDSQEAFFARIVDATGDHDRLNVLGPGTPPGAPGAQTT